MKPRVLHNHGFTLIELVLVIVILGIIATIATMKFSSTLDTARYEATLTEMNALANAIVGNPALNTNGARTDFGYVGDIGALPPNLDALATNPGYGTWNGPYIDNTGSDNYKKDGWNTPYTLVDTLIRSSGSGSNIDKLFASSSAELLSNTVVGYITDADGSRPTGLYIDSLTVLLTYPNGAGALATATTHPDTKGYFQFGNIPIGNHSLSVIYIPDADTMIYPLTIYPGRTTNIDISFPVDLW